MNEGVWDLVLLALKQVWTGLLHDAKHNCMNNWSTDGNTILTQSLDLNFSHVDDFRVPCLGIYDSQHSGLREKYFNTYKHMWASKRLQSKSTTLL